MRYQFKSNKFLDDLLEVGEEGARSVGLALSAFGLQYVNERFWGNSLQNTGDPRTLAEFGYQLALCACAFCSIIEGVDCAYDILRIPVRLVTGKYFWIYQPKESEEQVPQK
jgi:hypothetical protein